MPGPIVPMPLALRNSPAGAKISDILTKIGSSTDLPFLESARASLGPMKDYIVGKYGAWAFGQVSDALESRINGLATSGTDALPTPLPAHPFETFFNTVNAPTQAAMDYLDTLAKSGHAWQDFSNNPQQMAAFGQAEKQAQAAYGHGLNTGLQGTAAGPSGGQVIEDFTGWRPHGGAGGVALAVLGTGLEGVTNPLNYVPLGDFLKPIQAVARPIAEAIARDGFLDTSKLSPEAAAWVERQMGAAHDAAQAVKGSFVKYGRMPKQFVDLFRRRDLGVAVRTQDMHDAFTAAMKDYYQRTGEAATPELMQQITHHLEDKYYRPWLKEQGFAVAKGTRLPAGSAAEALAERLHAISQDVTSGEVPLGLREAEVPGYVRHVNLEYRKPGMQGTFGSEAQGMLHAQEFKRGRTIMDTVENLNKMGGNWESDWLRTMAPRLNASIRSQETQKLMDAILGEAKPLKGAGKLTADEWKAIAERGLAGVRRVTADEWAKIDLQTLKNAGLGFYRESNLRLFPAAILRDGLRHVEDAGVQPDIPLEDPRLAASVTIPTSDIRKGVAVAKEGAYILPKAVADELRLSGRLPARNMLSKALDQFNSVWKWGMTRIPFFHLHNILYNAYLGDGAMLLRRRFAQAIADVVHSDTAPMYRRAVESGAISDWRDPLVRASLANDAAEVRALEQMGGKPAGVGARIYQIMQDTLWKTDKVLRMSLFRKAVDSGMSDLDAARFVNHFMVDYQDLTPFEQGTMRTLFPFYAWQRHNMPLQFEAWLNQTGKQMLPLQFVQNFNQQMAQTPISAGGKQGAPYDVLLPLAGNSGNDLALSLNVPAKDPQELLDQGPAAFGFQRLSPVLQLLGNLATDERNPFGAANSYGKMPINVPTVPAWMQQLPAFGSVGPLVSPDAQIAIGDLGTTPVLPLELAAQFAHWPTERSAAGVPPAETAILNALGFYPSAFNPARQAFDNAYMYRLQMENLRSLLGRYLRDIAQPTLPAASTQPMGSVGP